MLRKSLVGRVFAAIAGMAMFASVAQATPITYTFSGSGSGSLGGTSFTDANFTIQIFGNTDDVLDPSQNLDLTANLTSAFTVSGVGSGSFTNPLFVFGGLGDNFLGFGDFTNANLIAFFGPSTSLLAYDLKTNFGPIVETNDNLNQFVGADTTAGDWTFRTMSPVTFTSVLQPTSVPEPSSLLLLGLGLAVFAGSRKKLLA